MLKKLLIFAVVITIAMAQTTALADVHAGSGVRLFKVTTEQESDIFFDDGRMIEYKKFTETDSPLGDEFVAGAYVYNDSLTNGDCVEMNIIIVEYSQSNGHKIPEAIHVKAVHACPGDNGKFVYTDPIKVDSSRTVKAMIWGKETIIPYGASSGYID